MWGDPGVTELQIQKDNSISVTAIGATPLLGQQGIMTLQHVGLLRRLRIRLNIPFTTGTGSTPPTPDVNGPWNLLGLFRADVNGIAPLYAVSGWGLFIISLLSTPFASVDSQQGAVASDAATFSEAFAFPAVTASGSFTVTAQFDLPFTVDINLPGQQNNIPTELGLWLLQNQTVDMVLTIGLNPLQNSTPGTAPEQGGNLINYAYGAATVDVEREFYRIPSDPAQMPILGWAHQWVETYVPFSGSALDLNISRAGVLLRAVAYIWDGGTNDGVAGSKITDMQWIYGANETPITLDNGFMRARQLRDYGKLMPKGTFLFDWYKWVGTPFQLVGSFKLMYNTEALVNQRVHFDFGSALAAGSYCRLLVERLIPIIANRNASPVATSGAPVGAQQAPLAPR